jgi:beta-galactosidase
MRIITDLNFDWLYKDSFREEYLKRETDLSGFESVSIPHTNIEIPYNYFDEEIYAFESCYIKNITIPEDYKGKDIFLCFDGAAHYAKVYLNGKLLKEHKGGYSAFDVKLNDAVVYGGGNIIAVHLDSKERVEIPPFGNVVDYLTYGGIYREVYLRVVEKIHIKDIFVKTLDVLEDNKTIEADIILSGFESGLDIEITLHDADGISVSSFIQNGVSSAEVAIRYSVSGIELWDLDSPILYSLTAVLKKSGEEIDKVSHMIGFREAVFKTDGFYLNGRMLKIRGLNRHQSYAYTGYAMPASVQADDARILKNELGVNLVRTSHYPQSKHFIDACDRLGLLVFTEIPGWQHVSKDEEWRRIVLQNVEEMILQNRNHPSIILWGVRINESNDDDPLYTQTNLLARKLDPTRQTGGVRCIAGSSLLEDVYTYNDFNYRGNNEPLAHVKKITGSESSPYLVTEHNGHMFPTKRFDHEEKRIEHAMRHIRVLNEMYGNDRISGAIGWCMSDYNTHKDFGSGDKICYHGVTDMFRIAKPAAYAYSSQQDKIPVMEIPSSMDIGEHPASVIGPVYVFTNCDFIRFYKNDNLIGDFYHDYKNFPHLPHPPVVIDDFVGPYLQENENLKKSHADIVKDVLNYTAVTGGALPLKYKLKMLLVMISTKLRPSDGYRLYSTYIGNWGSKKTTYKFEGYTGGKLIKTVVKSGVNKPRLKAEADRYTLIEDKTRDAVRVVLRMVCENDNLLPYAHETVKITCEGAVALIGDDTIPLIGGAAAFYIRTDGRSGGAAVKVSTVRCGESELEFIVEKR